MRKTANTIRKARSVSQTPKRTQGDTALDRGKSCRGFTNGYADPLRNYEGTYKEGIREAPQKASVLTPKPTVTDGRVEFTRDHIIPTRASATGLLTFPDWPIFKPNLTPFEILLLGSFGGTYFRSIYSKPAKTTFVGQEVFSELPWRDWGLEDGTMVQ